MLERELLHVCLEAQVLQLVREPLSHGTAPLLRGQICTQLLLELIVLLAEGRGKLHVLAVVEHLVRVGLQRILREISLARDSLVRVARE